MNIYIRYIDAPTYLLIYLVTEKNFARENARGTAEGRISPCFDELFAIFDLTCYLLTYAYLTIPS